MQKQSVIYLDHNASTPLDPAVLEAMLPYFLENHGNPHSSSHSLGWASAKAIDEAAQAIAQLIGCDSDEVIFTSGATESNNIAIASAVRGQKGRRRKIITSAIEHKSTLNICRALQTEGFETVIVPVDGSGRVDVESLSALMDETVFMCTFGAVNSEIGTIQPIKAIADLAHSSGVLVHWDAAQAPSAIPMHDFGSHADFVSLSSHKMYGPQGVGAVYVRRAHQDRIKPLMYGGGQQSGIRPGTLPTALCVGMGRAAEILIDQSGQDGARKKLRALRDRLVARIAELDPKVRLNGPSFDERHPGNANLQFSGFAGEDLLGVLQPGLAASTGSACTSGIPEPSHVLRGIGLSRDEALASVRFCLGRYTTLEEVDSAVEMIAQALRQLEPVRIAS